MTGGHNLIRACISLFSSHCHLFRIAFLFLSFYYIILPVSFLRAHYILISWDSSLRITYPFFFRTVYLYPIIRFLVFIPVSYIHLDFGCTSQSNTYPPILF